MRIAMIGAGYVGLVTAACLADFGHDITCIDQDVSRVDQLRTGCPPIYEPGLDVLLEQNLASGRLRFTTDLRAGVAEVDVVFLAVGTPARRGGGHADLTFVYSAATEVAQAITRPTVLVTKSTVPVGTADAIEGLVAQACPGAHVNVVSNPEFLREGCAIEDFKRPDRIVVGTTDDSARAVMEELYAPVCTKSQLMFTGRRTAELIKYASNAFLATKISFINEIADLCEVVGADVRDVAHGMGMDHRIGPKFLDAGPGYGGSCFPKDTIALVRPPKIMEFQSGL